MARRIRPAMPCTPAATEPQRGTGANERWLKSVRSTLCAFACQPKKDSAGGNEIPLPPNGSTSRPGTNNHTHHSDAFWSSLAAKQVVTWPIVIVIRPERATPGGRKRNNDRQN